MVQKLDLQMLDDTIPESWLDFSSKGSALFCFGDAIIHQQKASNSVEHPIVVP
jgi:hypothetical protein